MFLCAGNKLLGGDGRDKLAGFAGLAIIGDGRRAGERCVASLAAAVRSVTGRAPNRDLTGLVFPGVRSAFRTMSEPQARVCIWSYED
jgi:hypothetical protein